MVISQAEISIHDKDRSTSNIVFEVLNYPQPRKDVFEADNQQRILINFGIKDKATQGLINAHQAFIQFLHEDSQFEIFYVAEPESTTSKTYKFDLNIGQKAKDFEHLSGRYTINLIVGDSTISNPFVWKIGTIKLTLPGKATNNAKKEMLSAYYEPKPEIHHIFRAQEKRPASIFSDTFTVLTLTPVLVLLITWAKLGVNISNFPFSLSAIIFHLSLLSIFSLFTLFWLKLNMFTTIKCLLASGLITYLSGHRVLSQLATERLDAK